MPKRRKAESVRGAGRAAPPGETVGSVSVCRLLQRPGKASGSSHHWRHPG